MTILTLYLSITTFVIGFTAGRWVRHRRKKAEVAAEGVNRHYTQGYHAALKEFGFERRDLRTPEIVAGTDMGRSA